MENKFNFNNSFDLKKSMQEMMEFQSQFLKGMKNMAEIEKDNFKSDQLEKELIYSEDKMRLFHYKPLKKKICKVPVLITYALVNRQYMMDIQPDRSVIKSFLNQGLDVYIIDWGYPTAQDKYLTMDDYINDYMNTCVDIVRDQSKCDKINMLGVCQGGTFTTIYCALNPEKVNSMVAMVTPIEFANNDTLLFAWSKFMDIDKLVDAYGVIPGEIMNSSYVILKPLSLTLDKYVSLNEKMDNPEYLQNFVRMEQWIFDSPDQAGETIRQFVNDLYKDNKLAKNELVIGDKKVNLKNITMPVLDVYAEYDHLVPASSSKPLADLVGSTDVEVVSFGVGHIGMYVSSKSQKDIAPKISDWILKHS